MFEQLRQDILDLRCETTAKSWIMQLKALREVFEMNPRLQEYNNLTSPSFTRKGGKRTWLDDCERKLWPKGLHDFQQSIEEAEYICRSNIEGIWKRDGEWMQWPEWETYKSFNFRVLFDEPHLGANIKAGMVFKCVGYNQKDNTITLAYREGCYISATMDKVQITEEPWAYVPAPETVPAQKP